MSAVYFVVEGDRGVAYWRAGEASPDVFVAAVALDVYERVSSVRARFEELVSAVTTHFRRTLPAEAPTSRLAGWPCETCASAAADDLRHLAGQVSDASEIPLSPSGLPLGCCKVHAVAGFSSRPAA
jgi:hypothetical protein